MPTDHSKTLALLNSFIVTADELSKVLQEADKLHYKENNEKSGDLGPLVKMFRRQPERAKAIYFRVDSLAKIIGNKLAPWWTTASNRNGAFLTKPELIEAAAACPLSDVDGNIGFDINGFLAKVLEFAKTEGSA